MPMLIHIDTPGALPAAARALLAALPPGRRVLALHGPMGAGKTTFVAALADALGVPPGEVNSPTFAIVNQYATASGRPVYHFDMYRLEDEQQAFDIGAEDYFYSGALCVVEWPENAPGILPPGTLHLYLGVGPQGERTLDIPEL